MFILGIILTMFQPLYALAIFSSLSLYSVTFLKFWINPFIQSIEERWFLFCFSCIGYISYQLIATGFIHHYIFNIFFYHKTRVDDFSALIYPGIELTTARELNMFLINTLIH